MAQCPNMYVCMYLPIRLRPPTFLDIESESLYSVAWSAHPIFHRGGPALSFTQSKTVFNTAAARAAVFGSHQKASRPELRVKVCLKQLYSNYSIQLAWVRVVQDGCDVEHVRCLREKKRLAQNKKIFETFDSVHMRTSCFLYSRIG